MQMEKLFVMNFGSWFTPYRATGPQRSFAYKRKSRPLALPHPPRLIRWTFLLFIFLIPLEAIEFGIGVRGSLTLPRIVGTLFFGLCLFSRKYTFRPLQGAGWFFVSYFAFFFFRAIVLPLSISAPAFRLLFTLGQLFFFFWIASSLFRYENISRNSALAFSLGCFALSLCAVFNIGGMAVSLGRMNRLALDGFNPNYIAYMLAVSIFLLAGFCLDIGLNKLWKNLLIIGLIIPQVMLIMYSGSRGGIIALILALCLYVLPSGCRISKRKIVAIIGGIVFLLGIGFFALSDPMVATRIDTTVHANHKQPRDFIYENALDMVLERPFIGWGPVADERELGKRLGRFERNPHNIFLQVFLQLGIVGGLLFVMGLGLCVISAWVGRKNIFGLIPIGLLLICLVVNMVHDFLPKKATWFVLAISAAAPKMPLRRPLAKSKNYPACQGRSESFSNSRMVTNAGKAIV